MCLLRARQPRTQSEQIHEQILCLKNLLYHHVKLVLRFKGLGVQAYSDSAIITSPLRMNAFLVARPRMWSSGNLETRLFNVH
jgi:hypothetical protein